MQWLAAHLRLVVGVGADCLTFGGALLLARDGFQRLKELNARKIGVRFREAFPKLNLADEEAVRARNSGRWAWRGLILLFLGFALQIVVRILEDY
jgi:hypothetical protein